MIISRTPIAFVVLLASGRASAAPCTPAALVEGDPAMTQDILDALRTHGIRPPQNGCPSEKASVERKGDAIRVDIVDPDGRSFERRVDDVATATALIESFAFQAALPGPAVAPPPAVATREQDPEQPRVFITQITQSPIRGAIGVAAESSIANDGSVWAGARARACVRLGPVCVGGEARYATDMLVNGQAEAAEATRRASDLQLIAEYPVLRSGWSVTPGVGVGVGWLHVRRDFMDASGTDTVEIDAGGLRASAHLTAAVPLGHSVVLTLGAALDVSPNAHTKPFIEETHEAPGEPWLYGRFQLGLEMSK